MKLPNGYGSVSKMSGNRRRPWRTRVTIGYDSNGKPKSKTIGYYKTKREGMDALLAYRANPIPVEDITFQEVYQLWKKEKFPSLAKSTVSSYELSYEYCEPLYELSMREIRLFDLQALVDNSGKYKRTLELVKNVISQVFDYAVKYEYITPDRHKMVSYIDLSNVPQGRKITRKVFNPLEIERLWTHKAYIPLILIFTGMRIGEYLALTKNDVFEDHVKIRKAKTKAGVRDIPLIDSIRPYFHLSPYKNYFKFRDSYWDPTMEKLSMKHTIHDTRHTFTTLCTENAMDPRILKSILGHKYTDVTGVYTHISLETKLQSLEMIYERCAKRVPNGEKLSQAQASNNQLFRS